jgi:hypothetical protein
MHASRFGLFLLFVACSDASPPPFKPVADVRMVMASIVEPASDHYWDAVGWILDKQGVTEIAPQSPMAWDSVRNDAFVVAEGGNLLMMGTRVRDRGDWMQFAKALVDAGEKGVRAAEARDKQATFDAGAEIYYACSNCHAKYLISQAQPKVRKP